MAENSFDEYKAAVASGRYSHVIGADEVGFGSWAGPVLVCAVAVPVTWAAPAGLDDSKKLRPKRREELFDLLRDRLPYASERAESVEIDREGVWPALHRCFRASVQDLLARFPKALVVLDGAIQLECDHLHFPKADGLVPAVMAASVFAKVIRDRHMVEMAQRYPGYGFGKHAGYGTPEHQEALGRLGPTPIHRMSYLPLQKLKTAEEIASVEEPGIAVD